MARKFPQSFFIPDIYPEQIPTLVFETEQDLLDWITYNKGGYDFLNFMYTAIEYAVYNSLQVIQICKLVTPTAKIYMDISQQNYSMALSRILELCIEGEYYELCSEINSLIKIIEENKKHFE